MTAQPRTRYTLADVRASYGPDKAAEELHNEWAAYFIYRPLSYPFTVPLLNAGVSATAVSLIALFYALTMPLLALWTAPAYLWVGLGGALFCVLDCIDGNIARTTAAPSIRGGYVDFLADLVFRASFYAAVGLLASALTSALVATLLALLARVSREYLARRHPTEGGGSQSGLLVGFVSGLDWVSPLALIALGIAGHVDWLVWWLLAYSAIDFLHTQLGAWRQLR